MVKVVCLFVAFAAAASCVVGRPAMVRDDEPGCQCDATEAGYCNLEQQLNTTFNCKGTDAGMTCAKQIFENVFNGTEPECGCLHTFCEIQPQKAKNQTCVQRAFDTCWLKDKVGCTDDDDNNDNCVWYCMQWYINSGYDCNPVVRHEWSACEKDCQKYIKNPSSSDFDGTIYAECMYGCGDDAAIISKKH